MLGKITLLLASVIAIAVLCVGCGSSGSGSGSASGGSEGGGSAQDAGGLGPGITTPTALAPYKPSAKVGEKPDLSKVVAFAQDNAREFEQLIVKGLEMGAGDAGLEFKTADSNGDPQKQVQNMEQFLIQGVGALVTGPVEPEAQAPVMRKAIGEGVDMNAIVFGPATTQVNAPQYAGGKKLAEVAAEFIEAKLGSKADVVLFNEDSIESIRPRYQAMRDVLEAIPGVKIVADVEPEEIDTEHGFQTMTTILQKNPEVNVVLGADATVEGALAALEAENKDSEDQFLGGVDCENQALTYIAEGGAYKACVGTEPAIFGYALARYDGDWLEGKCVPQGISVEPVAVTDAAEVAVYREDEEDPKTVFADPRLLSGYLGLYGNICYGSRKNYLAYTWNPDTEREGE